MRQAPPADLRPVAAARGGPAFLRGRLALAGFALLVAATAVLAFGAVTREVVDRGLGSPAALNDSLILFVLVVCVMALSVGARVYLVKWISELVVADLRKTVFAHVLTLDTAFCETTRTGEVISRLTTDTALPQTVAGSTLAITIRNPLHLTCR